LSIFGVDGFVLVNAANNADLEGALECVPVINDCIAEANSFNIRATVFGDSVQGVAISVDGPVKGSKMEMTPPYAVFGDRNGDYVGKALLAGRYTVTAYAINSLGNISENYTMTFEMAEAPSQSPAGIPSLEPTPRPTKAPIPLPTPKASLAPVAPVAYPTLKPTPFSTSNPSASPSAQPTALLTFASEASGEPVMIRINSGGDAFTDSAGNRWEADQYYKTGRTYQAHSNHKISGTNNDQLYLSERYADSNDRDLVYEIPVPNGAYNVFLHFSDIYTGTQMKGGRVFDVFINRLTGLKDLDIYDRVGGFAALRLEATVTVTDGMISIDLRRKVQNPKLSGITIYSSGFFETASAAGSVPTVPPTQEPTSPPTSRPIVKPTPMPTTSPTPRPTPKPTREPSAAPSEWSFDPIFINCGGQDYTDSSGITWAADEHFSSGTPNKVKEDVSIQNTVDDALYRSERFGAFKYEIPVGRETNDFSVTLYFAEVYSGTQDIGDRRFGVSLEGSVAFENLDIVAETGGYTAMNRTKTVTVSDSKLTIEMIKDVQQPKLSAVEVRLASEARYADSTPAPIVMPTSNPSAAPTPRPTRSPTPKPTTARTQRPTAAPTPRPTAPPTPRPAAAPTPKRTAAPTPRPTTAPTPEPSAAPSGWSFEPIYINVGGFSFTDSKGIEWQADKYFVNGQTSLADDLVSIAKTNDAALYRSERYGTFKYEIPVGGETNDFSVTLYLADIYSGTQNVGDRRFSIALEGSVAFENLDIVQQAGGGYTAMNKTATVTVADGKLTIEMIKGVQQPKLSAIEVHTASNARYVDSAPFVPETNAPTPKPTAAPTPKPTAPPTPRPTRSPTPNPTAAPTPRRTDPPTPRPTRSPTPKPTAAPTPRRTAPPTQRPTRSPTPNPTAAPTPRRTVPPTPRPTRSPTPNPTAAPTPRRTDHPTPRPTRSPTPKPTIAPTPKPTAAHTPKPTAAPTSKPSVAPTPRPTPAPTSNPTAAPTPSPQPTQAPVQPLEKPIRINCGGKAFRDSKGRLWEADTYANTGRVFVNKVEISGTADPELYQSERYDEEDQPELFYDIPGKLLPQF
jgi:hypothetical protein